MFQRPLLEACLVICLCPSVSRPVLRRHHEASISRSLGKSRAVGENEARAVTGEQWVATACTAFQAFIGDLVSGEIALNRADTASTCPRDICAQNRFFRKPALNRVSFSQTFGHRWNSWDALAEFRCTSSLIRQWHPPLSVILSWARLRHTLC